MLAGGGQAGGRVGRRAGEEDFRAFGDRRVAGREFVDPRGEVRGVPAGQLGREAGRGWRLTSTMEGSFTVQAAGQLGLVGRSAGGRAGGWAGKLATAGKLARRSRQGGVGRGMRTKASR